MAKSLPLAKEKGDPACGRVVFKTTCAVCHTFDGMAQQHVLQRKGIISLTVSALSIMPAGFEVLPPDDLEWLLEYLTLSPTPLGSP